MSRVIDEAVRLLMQATDTESDAGPFDLVPFGAGGRFSRHNLDKTSTFLAIDDVERYRNR